MDIFLFIKISCIGESGKIYDGSVSNNKQQHSQQQLMQRIIV